FAIIVLFTLVVGCSRRNAANVAPGAAGEGTEAAGGSHRDTPNVPAKVGAGATVPYLATDRLLWAEYGTWDDNMGFLMWVDLVGDRGRDNSRGGGNTSSPSGVRYHGFSRSATGLNVEWQCETPDGVTGSMKVNGGEYNLAKGRVFLVTVQAGGTQVRQIERDLSKVGAENTTAVSNADTEIAKFITMEKK